jgi:hypothetical protein
MTHKVWTRRRVRRTQGYGITRPKLEVSEVDDLGYSRQAPAKQRGRRAAPALLPVIFERRRVP